MNTVAPWPASGGWYQSCYQVTSDGATMLGAGSSHNVYIQAPSSRHRGGPPIVILVIGLVMYQVMSSLQQYQQRGASCFVDTDERLLNRDGACRMHIL